MVKNGAMKRCSTSDPPRRTELIKRQIARSKKKTAWDEPQKNYIASLKFPEFPLP